MLNLEEGYPLLIPRVLMLVGFLIVAWAGLKKRYRKKGAVKWFLILSVAAVIMIPVAMVFSIGIQEMLIITVMVGAIFLYP